jgi:hypothetical protein
LRFVFDTNVLISALLLADSVPRRAFDRALDHGKVLLSFAVLAELDELSPEEVEARVGALTRGAWKVLPTTRPLGSLSLWTARSTRSEGIGMSELQGRAVPLAYPARRGSMAVFQTS